MINRNSFFNSDTNSRPDYDDVLKDIAKYVINTSFSDADIYQTARLCFLDALGCGVLSLRYEECTKLLGPIVPDTYVPDGVHIPGTQYVLDPIQAAFDISTMNRWLDYNDTWLAREWGHPSDNIGAILSVADYISRKRAGENKPPLFMRDVLTAMIKAYEIQGVLALENSFNQVGLDHVALVKIASTAVVTQLLGGGENEILAALSQAFVDGQSLRTYRHAPNTNSRKSWAAGDAASRSVRLAMMTMAGEKGIPSALKAQKWGFNDVYFKGQNLKVSQPYASYVMENILFKISYPAEFHAQTAIEAAIKLHDEIKDHLDEIDCITLTTQESAIRIISKTGPLYNPADRDHCLQYMVAIALIYGELNADYYEDDVAKDPRIDLLRSKMQVMEDTQFSRDYLDPDKRSIANGIQVRFKDGRETEKIGIEYPLGHKKRRAEGLPALFQKLKDNLASHYSIEKIDEILSLSLDQSKFEALPVNFFMDSLSSSVRNVKQESVVALDDEKLTQKLGR